MLLADTYLTTDPAWPWSLPGWGLPALLGVAAFLAVVTIWTYLGVRGASFRRVLLVLILRLLALLIAFILVLRPSLATEEEEDTIPSRLFVLLDYSESMKITDDFNGLARWDNARRILKAEAVQEALKKLQAEKVEIVYLMGAEDLRRYEPDALPTGKRTDMGTWLHEFLQRHGREPNSRGLILLGDGADNGSKHATRKMAELIRSSCPIYTFGLGKTNTTTKQNDIDLKDIHVDTDPVPVKTRMTIRVFVNAPGFENQNVDVGLYIQEQGAKGAAAFTTTCSARSSARRSAMRSF